MAILAVSALTNGQLRTDFTMTGTILSNGSIGQVGGIYDKVGAAKNAGASLVLVPKVLPTDSEGELYLLVQTNFGIPLVQVANISQAAHFAFNGNLNGISNETTYNFTKDYNTAQLPLPTVNCSASCNYSTFDALLNSTFNLTRDEVSMLGSNPKFSSIGMQFGSVLNQSVAIASHGYLYTAADFAFLDYVNAFYFNGYSTNRGSALSLLDRVQNFCNSLGPPPLTTTNYNYVISAELRQLWGNYTINNVVGDYNSSQIDSDQILDELYLGAEANGWCTAANLVYTESAQNGSYVELSPSLNGTAAQRLARAQKYGASLYYSTAQQAYSQSNYAAAILDADYAFALANASSKFSLPTQQLDNLSLGIARNSTYGVWATEFAREAQFYATQSALEKNATLAKSYAESSYAAAFLASQISNDTSVIHSNLISSPVPVRQGWQSMSVNTASEIAYMQKLIIELLVIITVLLLVIIALVAIILAKPNKGKKVLRRRRRK
jgi:predicted S18 family serine protease